MTRHVALGAVVFVAALVLLVGLASLPSSSPTQGTVSGSPVAAASTNPGPSGSSPSASSASASASAGASGPGAGSSNGAPPSGAAGSSSGVADAVLVGAGDIADCALPGDEATAKLLDGIDGTVFAAGDTAYQSGSAAEFRDCYSPTWGRLLARTYPVPGNHEWRTKDLAGYLGYFGTRAAPDGKTWYSFELGAWHVVMLDSECTKVGGCAADSAQGRWLKADLAASSATCTVAIWHRPRWSSGLHGDDGAVAPLWQILYDAGADLVLSGHDHDYERFAPQDPSGHEDRTRGIREFVVGTGGAALRPFRPRSAANSELRIGGVYGVIKLTLKAGSYDWQFLPTEGVVSDAGSGPCH